MPQRTDPPLSVLRHVAVELAHEVHAEAPLPPGDDRLEQIGLFQENETDVGQRPEFAHAALWLLIEHDYVATRHFVSHPDKRLTFSPITYHQKDNIF